MTEIGSFENQTVMKRMNLASLRGRGNIFGNVILNFFRYNQNSLVDVESTTVIQNQNRKKELHIDVFYLLNMFKYKK